MLLAHLLLLLRRALLRDTRLFHPMRSYLIQA
jgi:hypothetical protein